MALLSDLTSMDTPLSIRSNCDAPSGPPMTSIRKWNGFTAVRLFLGILLLVAAGLKLADDSLGATGGFDLLTSPLLRLTFVEVEALLGVWLLLGLIPRVLWFVSLIFFSMLASANLYLGMEGRPTCGCFGTKIPLNPWYSFALDLATLAALAFGSPSRGTGKDNHSYRDDLAGIRRLLFWLRWPLAFAVLAGAGTVLSGVAVFGSLPAFKAYLQGHALAVDSAFTSVGPVLPMGRYPVSFEITNIRSQVVTIVGAEANCRCVVVDELPLQLEPGEKRVLTLTLVPKPGDAGKLLRARVDLFLDTPSPQLVLLAEANVESDSAH
jgi:hypothetical protein